jgi:hypothetical protein
VPLENEFRIGATLLMQGRDKRMFEAFKGHEGETPPPTHWLKFSVSSHLDTHVIKVCLEIKKASRIETLFPD